jgi:hypothetical protein
MATRIRGTIFLYYPEKLPERSEPNTGLTVFKKSLCGSRIVLRIYSINEQSGKCLSVERKKQRTKRKEAVIPMVGNQLNFFIKFLLPLRTLVADSDSGGSMPEREEVQEKIKISKNRRIPVVGFIFLFVAIIITFLVFEYFI